MLSELSLLLLSLANFPTPIPTPTAWDSNTPLIEKFCTPVGNTQFKVI